MRYAYLDRESRGDNLYEIRTPDETIETIGDITLKDSAVTTNITNADYTGF